MTATETNLRFAFGQNWSRFLKRNFSEERLLIARQRILDFAGLSSLEGFDFLDIGCGSGLHSYGALRSGANRVHSFDYDPNSVAATRSLYARAGSPTNWTIEQGDVLDDSCIERLGKWSFVYSWGVLHHTGDMWNAIKNAQRTVDDDGYFFLALYSADAAGSSMEFWLDKKREYNRASAMGKQLMVAWYIWRFGMQSNVRQLPTVIKHIVHYRFNRGMNYFTDVRDWLGGYPMEYAQDQAVVDLLEGEFGFQLINAKTGEACTEFLFKRIGSPAERTLVAAFGKNR